MAPTPLEEPTVTSSLINRLGMNFVSDVCVNVKSLNGEGKEVEEAVFSHCLVLSSASALFRNLLSVSQQESSLTQTDLDLTTVTNGANAFKAALQYLYTGQLNTNCAKTEEILSVARLCQLSTVESHIYRMLIEQNSLASILLGQQRTLTPTTTNSPLPVSAYLEALSQYYSQSSNFPLLSSLPSTTAVAAASSMIGPGTQPTSTVPKEGSPASPVGMNMPTVTKTRSDSPPAALTSFDNQGDVIVPSNEKEGWCRNKKYIEKVAEGFQCTVCRKVYGRYNSVSYHVTIYHRNPPIKCEESGCTFTTREARYIHFHKYYRHHIPLPSTIDLAPRKCPYCRHVSKSPAMLEKHIARHENGHRTSLSTPSTSPSHRADSISPPQLAVPIPIVPSGSYLAALMPKTEEPASQMEADSTYREETTVTTEPQLLKCEQCTFQATNVISLFQHLTADHNHTPRSPTDVGFQMHCTQCSFSSSCTSSLIMHIADNHPITMLTPQQ